MYKYSDVTVGDAYKAFKDEGLSVKCDADNMTLNFEEEDEETDCD